MKKRRRKMHWVLLIIYIIADEFMKVFGPKKRK